MSKTALEAIEEAFEEIKVKTLGVPLQVSYVDRGIKMLNRMMNADATRGRGLGFTDISDSGETLTVPNWSFDYVILGLAKKLAPGFGKILSGETLLAYEEALEAVLRMTVEVPETGYFPSTLPVGAGNEGLAGRSITNLGDGFTGAFVESGCNSSPPTVRKIDTMLTSRRFVRTRNVGEDNSKKTGSPRTFSTASMRARESFVDVVICHSTSIDVVHKGRLSVRSEQRFTLRPTGGRFQASRGTLSNLDTV